MHIFLDRQKNICESYRNCKVIDFLNVKNETYLLTHMT